jgi:chorismate-pyruvate lyase
MASSVPGPDLRDLFGVFADEAGAVPPDFAIIPPQEVPEPYRRLLVHEHHMTVTLDEYHGEKVELRVLAQRRAGNQYARLILLALPSSGEVVQFGIMRIDFDCLYRPEVKDEILAGKTPLGRILIEHDVLRRIEPTAYLRITPNAAIRGWFNLQGSPAIYGRLAWMMCNNLPAIELLEVVRPAES